MNRLENEIFFNSVEDKKRNIRFVLYSLTILLLVSFIRINLASLDGQDYVVEEVPIHSELI